MRRLRFIASLIGAAIASLLTTTVAFALVASGSALTVGTSTAHVLFFTTSNSVRGQIDTNGNWVLNNGTIATNSADGFDYIVKMAGSPIAGGSTPTSLTGTPVVHDSTNNEIWFWNGSVWSPTGNTIITATWGASTAVSGDFINRVSTTAASASEAQPQQWVSPIATTPYAMSCLILTGPGVGHDVTYTLRKNGVNTGLTCDISNANTTCINSVTTETQAAAGAIWTVQMSFDGTPSGANNCTVAFR